MLFEPLILEPDTWRPGGGEVNAEACAQYSDGHHMTLMLKSRNGFPLMIGSTKVLDEWSELREAGISTSTCVESGSLSLHGGAVKRPHGGHEKMAPLCLGAIWRKHYDEVACFLLIR